MDIPNYYEELRLIFQEAGEPERALKQQAYMKDNFPFYGLMAPIWLGLLKGFTKKNGWPAAGTPLQDFVELCYGDVYREMHYAAIEAVQKRIKNCPPDYIQLLEHLIITHSWWDTVDWLAKLVGMYFKQYPEAIRTTTEAWMASGNMWLQRVCIIFQLFYKEKTDTGLLFDYILRVKDSKEFFLQKAAGWALRQHSKTDPDLVLFFIEKHETDLAVLTKREGRRLILKKEKPFFKYKSHPVH